MTDNIPPEATSAKFGSTIDAANLPGNLLLTAPSPEDVTLELLMASQAHMGHSTSLWNPMNSRYIFGVRHGIHVISLEATASHLKRAARVVESVCENAGIVLFVGTRRGQRAFVVGAAEMSGGCHLFSRWAPGAITNGTQLLQNCRIAPVTAEDRVVPGFEEECRQKLAVLRPDLVVILNPLEHKVLLHECALATIPTIGVIDTDADPTRVTFPIPANDDSLRCMRLVAGVLGRAGERGRLTRLRKIKEGGEIPYKPFDLLSIAFDDKLQKWTELTTVGGSAAAAAAVREQQRKRAAALEYDGDEEEDEDQAFIKAQMKKQRGR